MRAGRPAAINLGQTFFDQISINALTTLYIDAVLEYEAWEIFKTITQKDISFTDCATAAAAKHWGIDTILTFDRYFLVFKRQLGIPIVGV